jgi:hypothetical protein
MSAVLKPPQDLRLGVEFEPSIDGWRAVSHQLQIQNGLAFEVQIDNLGCDFIARCDGKRTVGDILREVAAVSHISPDKIAPGSLHSIRHMIQRGFLLPAELPAAAGSGTV